MNIVSMTSLQRERISGTTCRRNNSPPTAFIQGSRYRIIAREVSEKFAGTSIRPIEIPFIRRSAKALHALDHGVMGTSEDFQLFHSHEHLGTPLQTQRLIPLL
jgi:hypothetical protein